MDHRAHVCCARSFVPTSVRNPAHLDSCRQGLPLNPGDIDTDRGRALSTGNLPLRYSPVEGKLCGWSDTPKIRVEGQRRTDVRVRARYHYRRTPVVDSWYLGICPLRSY